MGEFLEKNCPGVSVKLVIKHKKEWSEFLDAVNIPSYYLLLFVIDLQDLRFLKKVMPFGIHY